MSAGISDAAADDDAGERDTPPGEADDDEGEGPWADVLDAGTVELPAADAATDADSSLPRRLRVRRSVMEMWYSVMASIR
jgi:hypothetical protein